MLNGKGIIINKFFVTDTLFCFTVFLLCHFLMDILCCRFRTYITASLSSANRGAKYLPYLRTALAISKELETFQQSIVQVASAKLATLQMKADVTKSTLNALHDAMEVLTLDLNIEIKNLLNDIEKMVRMVYKEEVGSLPVLVSDFQATFYNDDAVLNLYKQHLIR